MKTGEVLYWIVVDGETGQAVMRCVSRSEARRIASQTGGRVAKVVVSK